MKIVDLKVLITGSSGFLGSSFVDFLKKKGIPYMLYDRRRPDLSTSDFNAVVHFGGLTPHSKKVDRKGTASNIFHTANVEGTKVLLEAVAKNLDLKRFVNIGSFAEYGLSAKPISEQTKEKPVGEYAKSKYDQSALVEQFAIARKVKTINLRVANIVGLPLLSAHTPRIGHPSIFQNLTQQFHMQANGTTTIEVSHADDVRDYVDSEDVSRAVLAALLTEKGGEYEVINICSGHGTSLKEIVRLYSDILNRASVVKNTSGTATVSIGRNGKAKEILDWSPRIPFEESVVRILGSKKRLVIVGAGTGGDMVLRAIKREKNSDIIVIGFVDDDAKKQGRVVRGLPVLGTITDLPRIVKERSIDQVLVSTPSVEKELTNRVMKMLPVGFPIKVLPSVSNVLLGRVDLSYVRDIDPSDLIGRPLIKTDLQFISRKVHGKTFLVTGGAGSIGSEIVRQLRASGAKSIVIFDAWEEGVFNILEELGSAPPKGHTRIHARIGNVRDKSRLNEVMNEFPVDVILHAAAYKHVPLMEDNPTEARKTNYGGTKNVLDLAVKHKVKDFVLVSTDKAVHPSSVMGKTKRAAELLVKKYARHHTKYRFCAVRFGNVLNSSGSILPKFLRQIRSRSPVTVTHRDMTRYFMSIPEAVSLVLMSWIVAKNGQILLLDMGEPVRILDFAINLIKLHGLEPYVDIPIEETGVRPGEKIHEELSYDEKVMRPSPAERIFIAEEI